MAIDIIPEYFYNDSTVNSQNEKNLTEKKKSTRHGHISKNVELEISIIILIVLLILLTDYLDLSRLRLVSYLHMITVCLCNTCRLYLMCFMSQDGLSLLHTFVATPRSPITSLPFPPAHASLCFFPPAASVRLQQGYRVRLKSTTSGTPPLAQAAGATKGRRVAAVSSRAS